MAYGAYAGGSANPGGGMDSTMTDGPVETAQPPKEGGEMADSETGILPKALMAGKDFKVGDEIVLKITRVGENDFEVAYASGEGKEEMPKDQGVGEGAVPVDRSTMEMGAGMGSMME